MTENSDNIMSGDTITNSYGGHDVPLVFLRERDLFGNRKPSSNEWLKHEVMYRAISRKIDSFAYLWFTTSRNNVAYICR